MTIQNFPTSLQPAIQLGYLERKFMDGLDSAIVYRSIADLEIFPANVGETITKTRKGLKAPVTVPLSPSSNTNLDNGLTPTTWTVEQYVLGINMYGDTLDLNMVTQGVGIESQFLHNAYTNGVQAAQSVDRIARNTLFNAYQGGNTSVRVALGAPATSVSVDDIRGFIQVPTAGTNAMVNVSVGNPATVTFNGTSYTVTGTVADGGNVSVTPNGISGVLTTSVYVSVANGALGVPVVSSLAPTVLRPNGRTTTGGLISTDLFSLSIALDAVTRLRNNAVPTVNGMYNCYLDNTSARQLFADPDFKQLYQGQGAAQEFRRGRLIELLDLRFLPTTEAIQQTLGAINVHRPIVVGAGALVEGVYADVAFNNIPEASDGLMTVNAGIAQIVRAPLDRLRQIIAQSWYYIGGFTVPTDVTANQTIIPTASNALFKRAVMIETA